MDKGELEQTEPCVKRLGKGFTTAVVQKNQR